MMAALAAFCFVATPVAAQDVPWGHKSGTKKKSPQKKKAAKKKSAKKKSAAKKSTAKKSAAKKSAAKKSAAKKSAAKKSAAKRTAARKKAAKKTAAKKPPAKKGTAKKGPRRPRTNRRVGQKAKPTAKATGGKATGTAPKVELVDVGLLKHFDKELAPHGKWLADDDHGKVWVPNPATVGKDWAPYRDHGHWAVTDKSKWAWVSDMKWGKIPFHYGRWAWSPKKNWMWVPGTDHAPAWVVWRVADSNRKFIGWAPMAPTPKAGNKAVLPYYFVPTRYLFSPHLSKFVISNRRLAKKMHAHSRVFGGHAAQAVAPAATKAGGKKTAGKKTAGKNPAATPGASAKTTELAAATPTFKDVRVPAYALPKTKLASTNEAIAPIFGLVKSAADQSMEGETRFATPPPPEKKRVRRSRRRVRKVRRSRARGYRNWKKGQPRYRCWWTNTRPRIWRCGY